MDQARRKSIWTIRSCDSLPLPTIRPTILRQVSAYLRVTCSHGNRGYLTQVTDIDCICLDSGTKKRYVHAWLKLSNRLIDMDNSTGRVVRRGWSTPSANGLQAEDGMRHRVYDAWYMPTDQSYLNDIEGREGRDV